jgi:serine/threonine-protein kinase
MGVVLKAHDPALNRVVAIKVLTPQLATSGAARKRFAREARAAAAVVHEHVIAIHAVDSWNGLPYLVMPYIAGRSLQERIDRDGPLEVKEVLRIGLQAAKGLAEAHAQGLVHRDVKPSNILLENGVERVWLTDFGLARAADDASLTQSGVVAGTPHYMAPEQARGETVDHRADLFSLGGVLYAMCVGHPPFRAGTTLAVLRRVSEEQPRLLRELDPELPSWLTAIVAKLHATDPALRYQTANEVAQVLGRHLADLQRPSAQAALPRKGPLAPLADDWENVANRPKGLGKAPATAAKARPGGWSRRRSALLVAAGIFVCGILGATQFAGSGLIPNGVPFAPQQHDARKNPPKALVPTQGEQSDVIVGSGKLATNELAVADFDSLEVLHPFQVEVVRANRFHVDVTADDNVINHVKGVKEGSTLTIMLDENKTYHLKAGSLGLKISMPALSSIGLSHGPAPQSQGSSPNGPSRPRFPMALFWTAASRRATSC